MKCCIVVVVLVGAAGCGRKAAAQGNYESNYDPLAPVECFKIVDAAQLSGQSALELCASARTTAPADCYVESINAFHELADSKILQLCDRATTTAPVRCYAELRANNDLTEDQMIAYCTTTCAFGPPPPESSNAACLDDALDYTDLSLQLAGELCDRSSSNNPVACFVAGQAVHKIADSSLISLCQEYRSCQSYYGTSFGEPGVFVGPSGTVGSY